MAFVNERWCRGCVGFGGVENLKFRDEFWMKPAIRKRLCLVAVNENVRLSNGAKDSEGLQ